MSRSGFLGPLTWWIWSGCFGRGFAARCSRHLMRPLWLVGWLVWCCLVTVRWCSAFCFCWCWVCPRFRRRSRPAGWSRVSRRRVCWFGWVGAPGRGTFWLVRRVGWVCSWARGSWLAWVGAGACGWRALALAGTFCCGPRVELRAMGFLFGVCASSWWAFDHVRSCGFLKSEEPKLWRSI